MTLREALAFGMRELPNSESPWLDSQLLLAHAIGQSKEFLLAHGTDALAPEAEADFRKAVALRSKGLPVAYITGRKEFYGREFCVSPDVLIPKPDTELLVERALESCRKYIEENTGSVLRIADLCCGSGCVGASIAAELAGLSAQNTIIMDFIDISGAALEICRRNAQKVIPPNIEANFILSDLLGTPQEKGISYNMIASNPPYVPTQAARNLLLDGRSEPMLALDGGADGLDLVRRLAPQAAQSLAPGGAILLEAGEYNIRGAARILGAAGFAALEIHRDLAGMERVVCGRRARA